MPTRLRLRGLRFMSAIELRGVTRRWGSMAAVDNVNFIARERSFVVLLGPSGCGKSTTLRLIAGLDQPTEGQILIGGSDVTELSPAQRRISMVFQSYALFPHLNVRENILFGLRVRREPASEHESRLARVVSMLGLEGLLERKPAQLSGGQQQRVALGRAIIAQTSVCLMDEPLSNLDAKLRQEMRREIRGLQRTLGITMVYVTHDQTEAMSMADQVVLMNAGRIEQDASPAELYARPASVFCARFIGTPPMNVFAHPDNPALLLGVRPEHLRMLPDGAEAERTLACTVAGFEYLGADSIVALSAPGGDLALRMPGRHEPEAGRPVRVGWNLSDEHRFDAASGRRVEVEQ